MVSGVWGGRGARLSVADWRDLIQGDRGIVVRFLLHTLGHQRARGLAAALTRHGATRHRRRVAAEMATCTDLELVQVWTHRNGISQHIWRHLCKVGGGDTFGQGRAARIVRAGGD